MEQQPNNSKDRLKEITDSIEHGIQELFESDKYKQYLRTMSRFHNYSLNNTMLIAMQRPDATLVAGFNKWRDQFGRNVMRGERGIKIIAPTPYKLKQEREKIDPATNAPMRDANGNVMTEEIEIKIPRYKVVSVFDVSQTDGRPLPTLAADLAGDVKQYDVFLESLRRSAPVPIRFEILPPNVDGYFRQPTEDNPDVEKDIAIRKGMSEVQTVCATIHEIGHAKLHDRERLRLAAQADPDNSPKPKDRHTREVEAESVSYAVCQYYGIETGQNSFGYIAGWSKDKTLPELRESLETINRTADGLITDIDRHFAEICKERGICLSEQEAVSEAAADNIALRRDAAVSYPYADGLGYPASPELRPPINHLRSVEDMIEQNDNQLDGIINNTPTQQEERNPLMKLALELRAKSESKRASVMERLKVPAQHEQQRPAHKCAEMER